MPEAKLKQTKKTQVQKDQMNHHFKKNEQEKKLSTVIFKRKSEPSIESQDDLTWLQQHVKD